MKLKLRKQHVEEIYSIFFFNQQSRALLYKIIVVIITINLRHWRGLNQFHIAIYIPVRSNQGNGFNGENRKSNMQRWCNCFSNISWRERQMSGSFSFSNLYATDWNIPAYILKETCFFDLVVHASVNILRGMQKKRRTRERIE